MRYKSQAKQWLASRFNPDRYGDKLNVQNTFDLSVVLNAAQPGKILKKLKRLQGEAIETQPEQMTQPKPQWFVKTSQTWLALNKVKVSRNTGLRLSRKYNF